MKYSVLIILLITAFPVLSGNGSGKVNIEYAGAWEGKELLFFYTDSRFLAPECNTYNGRWVVNIATEEGKAKYHFLRNAQKKGKNIKVIGSDDCNVWGNSETADIIQEN